MTKTYLYGFETRYENGKINFVCAMDLQGNMFSFNRLKMWVYICGTGIRNFVGTPTSLTMYQVLITTYFWSTLSSIE